MRLLRLNFKLDHTIKSKASKYVVKIFLAYYELSCLILLPINTMETCCVSCKKNTANKNSSVKRIKQNRLMLLLNCVVCGKKKSRLIKNQEANKIELN